VVTTYDYNVVTWSRSPVLSESGTRKESASPRRCLSKQNYLKKLRCEPSQGRLVVTAARTPRAGWADAAREMHASGEDQLLDEAPPSVFDDEEWEW
jgi:hypothetical protein